MYGKFFDSQKDRHSMLLENELSWNPDSKENRTAIDREFRRYFRIANARNPFSRLYSAWNDKSRTHLHQNESIASYSINVRTKSKKKHLWWSLSDFGRFQHFFNFMAQTMQNHLPIILILFSWSWVDPPTQKWEKTPWTPQNTVRFIIT